MIDLLLVGRERGYDALREAVDKTLAMGCSDVSAVLLMLNAGDGERRSGEPVDVGALCRFDRPLPTTTNYDQLLARWPDTGAAQ